MWVRQNSKYQGMRIKKYRPKGMTGGKKRKTKKNMQFIESTHDYTEKGIKFTPATYFLKTFQQYVDWDAKCKAKAKKLGIPYEELKKQWDREASVSSNRGTKYHNLKEKQDLESQGIILEDTLCKVHGASTVNGIKEDYSCKLENNSVYVEKMVWNTKYKICGTADKVEVVNGKINIKDYKTNKEIKTRGFKNWDGTYQKMKFPISNMEDCHATVYSLQVNLYMYMLLQQNRNLKIGTMEIHHITFNENDEPNEPIIYKVKNYQKEIKAMLDVFSKRK